MKNRTSKKILAFALAVALTLTAIPAFTTPVSAAGEIGIQESATASTIDTGDTVYFGTYPQTDLEKNLDAKPYNTASTSITWETSTVRAWLNNYAANGAGDSVANPYDDSFIDTVFNQKETAVLVDTAVKNDNNPLSIPLNNVGDGTYTLKIFSEQVNDDYYTDFCSSPVEMTMVVAGGNGSIIDTGTLTVDNTSLTVTVEPSGTNVPVTVGKFVLTFSEKIDILAGSGRITMTPNKINVNPDTRWDTDRKVLTVPLNVLEYSTQYEIGISGFKDLAGNEMVADTKTFTTEAASYALEWDGDPNPSGGFAPLTYGYTTGRSVTYTIKNTGNQQVDGITASISTGSGDFKITAHPDASLAPNSTTTVTVTGNTGLNASSTPYSGELKVTWTGDSGSTGIIQNLSQMVNAKNFNSADITIDAIPAQPHTGGIITPGVTVKDGATTLTPNVDYTVSYENNTNAGQATVTVTGQGNYTGTKNANFTIDKADYTGTKSASAFVRAGQVTTDAIMDLPALPAEASYLTGDNVGTIGGADAALISSHRISGSTLIYSTASQSTGTSATITIPVTGAANYSDYYVVVI